MKECESWADLTALVTVETENARRAARGNQGGPGRKPDEESGP
jgi:hypothetical protein